jgi:hypothetical protein
LANFNQQLPFASDIFDLNLESTQKLEEKSPKHQIISTFFAVIRTKFEILYIFLKKIFVFLIFFLSLSRKR